MNAQELNKRMAEAVGLEEWETGETHFGKGEKRYSKKPYVGDYYHSTGVRPTYETTDAIFAWCLEMKWYYSLKTMSHGVEVTIFKGGVGRRSKHSLEDELATDFASTEVRAMRAAIEKALSEGGE